MGIWLEALRNGWEDEVVVGPPLSFFKTSFYPF